MKITSNTYKAKQAIKKTSLVKIIRYPNFNHIIRVKKNFKYSMFNMSVSRVS